MGAAAEAVSLQKDTESRGPETAAAPSSPGPAYDPFVDRFFQGAPAEPPDAAARSLSKRSLQAPVLQRAQRLYGNRAAQQIVTRSRILQRKCDCGGTCLKCQDEEQQRVLQRKSGGSDAAGFDGIPATSGEPLGPHARRPLEAHFQTDLSEVRVHTSAAAADSASRLDALAYTAGRDIYFASGRYAPASTDGQRLLAHEVAHVVQQGAGKQPAVAAKSASGVKIGASDDVLETEADEAAEEFLKRPQPAIQRHPAFPALNARAFGWLQRQAAAPAAKAPAGTVPVGASNPIARYAGLVLALDDATYTSLSNALRAREISKEIRKLEATPGDNAARIGQLQRERQKLATGPVTTAKIAISKLAATDTIFTASTDFGKEIVTDLRHNIPAGPLLRDETLQRFMTRNYPDKSTAEITVPDPAGQMDSESVLNFTVNGVAVASADGFLHLGELDKAAASKLESIANDVLREADAEGELASLLVAGPSVASQFGELAKTIKASPKNYALEEVDQMVKNVAQMQKRMTEISADGFGDELRGYAQQLDAVRGDLAIALAALKEFQGKNPCLTADETVKKLRDDTIQQCADGNLFQCGMLSPPSSPSLSPDSMGMDFRLPNEVDNFFFNLFTWGAGTDMDEACKAYRTGKISLASKENLTEHALYKAGVAIGLSVAASFLGGWLGGIAGKAVFGASTLGAALTASAGAGLFGGVGGVAGQDIYTFTAQSLSDDKAVQQYMRIHAVQDYLKAGGFGALMGLPFGALHYYGAPPPALDVPPSAGNPITLYDATGQRIQVSGGQILPPKPGAVSLTLPGVPDVSPQGGTPPRIILPSQGVPPPGSVPLPVLQSAEAGKLFFTDASGRPLTVSLDGKGQPQISLPSATTLLNESRLVTPSGTPVSGQVPAPVQPLLDMFGNPIQPPSGPVIVDLQAGTPAFLRQQVAQIPGARGVGVEPGNYLLAYQGIYPSNVDPAKALLDMQMAQMIARNSPVWPGTPAWQTPLSAMPRLLPWEMDPATYLFPQQGSVTMLPDPNNPLLGSPFFPALGGRLNPLMPREVPFGLGDITGFRPSVLPEIQGVDQMYLRRAFGLGNADAETTAAMGRQIAVNLKAPGSFLEIRATRASELSVPTPENPGALDQPAIIAEQIPGAKVYRVTEAQIRVFQRTGRFPPGLDPIQQDMIRGAAQDVQGLGKGEYKRLIRIRIDDAPTPTSVPTIQRQCACGGTCARCQAAHRANEEEQVRVLQRSSTAGETSEFNGLPAGEGEPLDMVTRHPLEAHFQADLSDVRIHTGAAAADSSASLDALAYTAGQNIYFAQGMYAPSSSSGKRLLAHEVAHVVQQSSGKQPAIATKSAHGVKIGAPDDPLETEADQAAQEFMSARPPADQDQDRPKGRAPSGSVQTFIQRQEDFCAPAAPAPPAIRIDPIFDHPGPDKPAAPPARILKTLDGIQLADDESFMYGQIQQLMAKGGEDAAYDFLSELESYANNPDPEEDIDGYDLMKVVAVVRAVILSLFQEHSGVINSFEDVAVAKAKETLYASEIQERAEAIHYGIGCKPLDYLFKPDSTGGEQSPAIAGLQAAAQVLLGRRKELDEARERMDRPRFGEGEGSYSVPDGGTLSGDQLENFRLDQEAYAKKLDAYSLWRGHLGQKYPILKAYSDPEDDSSGLETLANQKLGPQLKLPLGLGIAERLSNITKVREGLANEEVSIWKLPDLVNHTMHSLGADANPLWKRWIEAEVAAARPGLIEALEAIALVLLNIGALVLAAPTGGASLVVAAGVNAAVAVQHIKEYRLQKALTGTAFDKAEALSRDDPSFFWLAVEVVGVAFDFATAYEAVSSAVKAVRVAKEVGNAGKIAEATDDLEKIAKANGGDRLAARVMAQLESEGGVESKVLKALEATDDEKELLKAGERELEKSGVIPEEGMPAGVKVDNNGRLWHCSSPCQWAREEFAQELAADSKLDAELAGIEDRVAAAAKPPRNMQNLTKAEAEAKAFFDKMAAFRSIEKIKQIKALLPELEVLDEAALGRVLAKAPNPGQIKGQLLEELLNTRMAKPGEIAAHVPAKIAKRLEQEGAELEFIPGNAIRDSDGKMISDGVIGYWKDDRFHIVTFFEAKAGRASGRGLRRAWTGIPKAERAEVLENAQKAGLKAFRDIDQDAAEALSEAASAVKKTNSKAARLTLDDVLNQFPEDVQKAWLKLPQSEAGQISKTTQRWGRTLEINGREVEVTTVSSKLGKQGQIVTGRTPHAVGVLPSDVVEGTLEETMKQSGITSFERMQDVGVSQAELDSMAAEIAKVSEPATVE